MTYNDKASHESSPLCSLVGTRCRTSVTTVTYSICGYGVATISRLLKIIGLFFAKEPYKRDYILQKRPRILRSLLIVATPYDLEPCVTRLKHKFPQICLQICLVARRLLDICCYLLMRGGGLGSSTIREVGGWGRVPLERWGAGVEYHFQEFNEPYAPS